MSKAQADEFRAYARECFELARATSSGTQRQSLLDEAADWLRAATAADDGFHQPDLAFRPRASQEY